MKEAREEVARYIETGDLDAIAKRGTLRILTFSLMENTELPRNDIVTRGHIQMAQSFAEWLTLTPEWILVDSPEAAIEALREGKGDLIGDNLSETKRRHALVDFSKPLAAVNEFGLIGKDAKAPDDPDNLTGRKLLARKDSLFSEWAERYAKENPEMHIDVEEIPNDARMDDLVDRINAEPDSILIADSNEVNALKHYRDDFQVLDREDEGRHIAWALRKESPQLIAKLNEFITFSVAKASTTTRFSDDWDKIKKRGVIRMLTRNSPETYYIWRGRLMGFDFDLARQFALNNKLGLQVVAVPSDIDLLQMLKEGKGDFVASSLTVTPEREGQGATFTAPYVKVGTNILSNKQTGQIDGPEKLKGKVLTVRYHSPVVSQARALAEQHGFEVQIAPRDISTDAIISKVASGEYDATIVDTNLAEISISNFDTLLLGMKVGGEKPQAMAVRDENPALAEELNTFIAKAEKSGFLDKTYDTYFKPEAKHAATFKQSYDKSGAISPFDDIVKKAVEGTDFDWRLIVAQMWQESRFDPKAKSHAGAQGLMQVMPATAKGMGYKPPLYDPKKSVKAGVEYMVWVENRFKDVIEPEDKIWFTLASYNAGIGHVFDARRLAKQQGWNKDVWFGNVEKAMLLLEQEKYFRKARYGYARGSEPVHYVKTIREHYVAYAAVAKALSPFYDPEIYRYIPIYLPSPREFAAP
ncbi:hypothetical protein MNKW57_28410 [Biformimicrobium ophioploci]|uniref:Solute-binding protein family 3/N-terminal domain-containing protein n=1 Tax=Biformimicrobium ophioploci TaxID=3036711 RepID=A0ABQ6M2M4_9GAMM|nr:hypothetical protein MNKW57_28410 [Microbulbifer sp. NKW57]